MYGIREVGSYRAKFGAYHTSVQMHRKQNPIGHFPFSFVLFSLSFKSTILFLFLFVLISVWQNPLPLLNPTSFASFSLFCDSSTESAFLFNLFLCIFLSLVASYLLCLLLHLYPSLSLFVSVCSFANTFCYSLLSSFSF